jgi:hypothetical protein
MVSERRAAKLSNPILRHHHHDFTSTIIACIRRFSLHIKHIRLILRSPNWRYGSVAANRPMNSTERNSEPPRYRDPLAFAAGEEGMHDLRLPANLGTNLARDVARHF